MRTRRSKLTCDVCDAPAVRGDEGGRVHADGTPCVRTCAGCGEFVAFVACDDIFVHSDGGYSFGTLDDDLVYYAGGCRSGYCEPFSHRVDAQKVGVS